MTRRKKGKIIAGVGVVAAVVVIVLLASANTRPYIEVDTLLNNPQNYYGKNIQVIGFVDGYVNGSSTFNMTKPDYAKEFVVDATGLSFPDGFTNGTQVVIEGMLNTSMIFRATTITTQCSQ